MKYCSFLRIAALAFAGLMGSSVFAAVVQVSPTGDYATDTKAITDAIDKAGTGGTVELGEGTFVLNGGSGITVNGCTVKGSGWEKTVIKSNMGTCNRLFKLTNAGKIEGVTMTGFNGNYRGVVVYAEKGTVSWCCISNNVSTAVDASNAAGCGICILEGTVDHCLIAFNSQASNANAFGAGIGGWGLKGDVTIDTCLIYGNTNDGTGSHSMGAGIGFSGFNAHTLKVCNCTIADNSCVSASGGIYTDGEGLVMQNNILYGNTMGGDACNLTVPSGAFANFKNCLFGLESEASAGTDCVSADPKFSDAANHDYHIGAGSPAVAAGTAVAAGAVDLDKVAFAATPSIGCYECDSITASPKFSPEDGRTFVSTLDVTLTCSTEGATIKYTTNGGDPASGTVYNGTPIRLTATTTIKAQAFAEGTDPSPVVTAIYTKETARGPAVSGGAVGVTPRATGAVIEGTVSDIGNNGATKCDVYLVYATSPSGFGEPVKIASGLVSGGMFKYTVSGLSPSTSYSYKLTVTNDAETPMSAAVSGSFTTKDAGTVVEPGGSPEDTWQILQDAIDSSPNETVRLAEARFEIKKELTINNGCSLLGNPSRPDRVVIALVTQTSSDGDHSMLVINNSPDTVVSGITFTGAGAHGGDNSYGPNSGVQMDSGTLEDCVIRDIITRNNSYSGAGVNMTGGTLRRCTISGCDACDSGAAAKDGDAIYMTGGLVENCIIRNNGPYKGEGGSSADSRGGAVCLNKGGTLRGCLVCGNRARNVASGVCVVGGAKAGSDPVTVENCTITANTQSSATSSASTACGLAVWFNSYWANPRIPSYNVIIRNNIVWGNVAYDGKTEVNCNLDQPSFSVGTLDWASSVIECNDSNPALKNDGATAKGNISADPQFTNADGGDYHPGYTDCTDGGSDQDWMATAFDLDGNARIIFAHVDIGCYERTSQGLKMSITTDGKADRQKVTLSCSSPGTSLTEIKWTLTRQQDGRSLFENGSPVDLELESGTWDVSVTVNGGAETKGIPGAIAVKASFAYANAANGFGTYPYNSKATGSPSINEAFDILAEGGTLYVAAGSYVIDEPLNLVSGKGRRIQSLEGNEKTVVRLADAPSFRSKDDSAAHKGDGNFGLQLEVAGAYVDGLTFVAGRPGADYDGPQYALTGFVKVKNADAKLVNCVFRDFRCCTNAAGDGNAKGLELSAGTVENCTFSRITCYGAGGAVLNGGVILITGGLADRIQVLDCEDISADNIGAAGYGVIVSVNGGELRNSLVAGCVSLHGAPVMTTTKIVNCTIVGNMNTQPKEYSVTVNGNTGVVTTNRYCHVAGVRLGSEAKLQNSIVAGNTSIYVGGVTNIYCNAEGSKVTYTLTEDRDSSFATAENHNIAYTGSISDIFFNPGGGDYKLKSGSPAIDKAKEEDWMLNTLDLAGNARSVGRAPDMGCFEYISAVPFGITVFIQ